MEHTLEIKGIKKYFTGTKALDWEENESLKLTSGNVYALVGENGAGKSTLAKIIAGIQAPSAGAILLDGETFAPHNSKEAREAGIGIVLQEPGLIPSIKVSENLLVGKEKSYSRRGVYRIKRQRALAREILAHICPRIQPDTIVSALTLEDQKLVEIARAITPWPKVLLIDETSAALSKNNVEILFQRMREARDNGSIVLFVTHRMGEVFDMCNKAIVLKDGKLVRTVDTADTDIDKISALMVGREIENVYARNKADEAEREAVLSVRHLALQDSFEDISFTLKKGRVIGIGGLSGGGKDEILPVIFGSIKGTGGEVTLDGRDYAKREPRASIEQGMAYIPREREREGLILRFSIKDNIILPSIQMLSVRGMIQKSKEWEVAKTYSKKLAIKTNSVANVCESLSGGNRQKVIIARWMARGSRVLLLDNPTRGIDVGARGEIYSLINELTDSGASIVMVTDDLPELISMSDEIYVVRQGKISAHIEHTENTTEQDVVGYMI